HLFELPGKHQRSQLHRVQAKLLPGAWLQPEQVMCNLPLLQRHLFRQLHTQ
ncbi:uncharacterized, partial [Tachysurus ichikawai]